MATVRRPSGLRVICAAFWMSASMSPHKGWDIYYQIPETHQDPQLYKNPEQFDPDRFSPERAEDKQKVFSHIPFGGGIRECLGKEFARLEMKIFAALLVRHYQWELLPHQNLERTILPFSRPRDGLKVKFWRYEGDRGEKTC
ncbi:cytochrome P450 [Chroococcidiopsis sp.]|uniref:cytochrome P450 n=1 Tax=Chroococcidiopsis sp. TaxID=3088168 RepID=UPI003F3E6EA7